MFRAAISAVFASSLSAGVNAETGLWEVYQQALRNDPTILASEMTLKATEERVDQSFSGLLPTLSATYSLSREQNERVAFDFDSNTSTLLQYDTESESDGETLNVNLSQVIYNHQTWLGLDISKKRALKAGVDHEVQKQSLIIRVSEAYFNILGAQDKVDFSSAEMNAIKQELEQTNQKFEVGLIAITDVHEAQARYDQAVADNIVAQNELDNALESLREITNEYYEKLQPLKPKFELRLPEPANVDKWLTEAEKNNLNFNASKIEKDIARETIKLNFAGHYPSLDLSGTFTDSENETTTLKPDPLPGDSRTRTVPSERTNLSLTLSVPIYSGGNTQSKVREAQSLFQQAVHNMEKSYRSAIRETKSAYLGIQASISAVKALEQSTVSSQAALEATQAGFEVGTRTIVDVLNATRTVFSAKQNLARAKYNYILNTLRLKQAAGTLSEQDLRLAGQLLKN